MIPGFESQLLHFLFLFCVFSSKKLVFFSSNAMNSNISLIVKSHLCDKIFSWAILINNSTLSTSGLQILYPTPLASNPLRGSVWQCRQEHFSEMGKLLMVTVIITPGEKNNWLNHFIRFSKIVLIVQACLKPISTMGGFVAEFSIRSRCCELYSSYE